MEEKINESELSLELEPQLSDNWAYTRQKGSILETLEGLFSVGCRFLHPGHGLEPS